MHRDRLLAGAVALALVATGWSGAAEEEIDAAARFVDTEGALVGSATFREGPQGLVIRVDIEGLPPGWRAIHIHEHGECDPEDGFESAGEHFDPPGAEHGFLNPDGPHAGDLPNIHVFEDGTAKAEFFLPADRLGEASLLAGGGTSLVIHEDPDDHMTDPAGDAGDRLACAVIERIE